MLLFAYMVLTYLFVRNRSFPRILLSLTATTTVTALAWVVLALVLYLIAGRGYSDVSVQSGMIDGTFNRTLGLPFNLTILFPALNGLRVNSLLTCLALIGLFALGGLITILDRVLSRTRYSIQKHGLSYMAGLVTLTAGIIVLLLWSQPSRNPDMPLIPIPEEAIGVTYTHTEDENRWPMTVFDVGGKTTREIAAYYTGALTVDGWKLERGLDFYEGVSLDSVAVFFSRGDKLLRIAIEHGYGESVVVIMRPVRPGELSQLHTPVYAP